MKIAIPVDEKKMSTCVCASFGRTPFYMLYNTENEEAIFLDNSAANAQGGAGIKAAQIIIDEHAEVLLTASCGENAAAVLNAAQIKIYKITESTAKENIAAYISGKLVPITEFHAGFHGKQ